MNTAFWLFLWDFKGKSINHFQRAGMFFSFPPQRGFLWIFPPPHYRFDSIPRSAVFAGENLRGRVYGLAGVGAPGIIRGNPARTGL